MKRSLFLLGLLLLPLTPAMAATDVVTGSCTTQTYDALAKEQRMFRSVVYGAKKAADLPVNSILYDKDGGEWFKAEKNSWKEIPKDDDGNGTQIGSPSNSGGGTKTDGDMDDVKDTPTRKGLLEAARTTTSDIVPGVSQSLRALECHLRAVCEVAVRSQFPADDKKDIKVQPMGCIDIELPPMKACDISDGISPALTDAGVCDSAADAIFQEEINLLSLSVSYDASYRTIAQFSGMFEGFLAEFRFPLLNPLWQTVRVLGGLKDIPCFLSQCEE